MEIKSDNKHIVMKKYLSQHSLVESNIVSFNNFIDKRMQEIVNEISENTNSDDEFEIKLGKISVEKPNIIEADGSISYLTPTEARLRNLTYSAPVFLEISVKQGGQVENHNFEIGRIPIIVKSKICNVHGLTKGDFESAYMDPLDPGGYFIINGNERVIVMIEDLAPNQPFIGTTRGKLILRLFSLRGSYRIPVSITETNEGILETNFSRFKNIPTIVLLKALGLTKESDIAKYISKENDSLIVNIYEYANIATEEDAMMFIAEKTSLQGTKKEMVDRVKQRLDSYLMPHIGLKKENRIEKAVTLCKLIKHFYSAKDNPLMLTNKDHYANKRVRLSGDLLSDLFRVNMNILLRDIQYSLQKVSKRKKFYSVKTIAKSTLFSHRMESAIATGSWIGETSGVTQNMDKTNYLAILSELQRVSSQLPGEQENFQARTLHPTHYGRFCPIETPEGTEIGLRKNLSILCRISTRNDLDDKNFLRVLESLGMISSTDSVKNDSSTGKETDVFFNGRFVGSVSSHDSFAKELRELRRNNRLPLELSVGYNKDFGSVNISSEIGRVLRPLIVVDSGVSKLTPELLKSMENDETSWSDLLKQGVIEYIDASEEENAFVSLNPEELTPEHTHLEIDPIDLFGLVTSIVPYANHNQASRLLRGSKTQKQALGIYAANYPIRVDTDVSVLHYPQKPLVRSFVYDTLNIYPAGQNVVVAVMSYEGYNMEDALIINKGSLDRGLYRSTYFHPYVTKELHYAGGLSDKIEIPEKDTSRYRTKESYRFLEDDGIAYVEADMGEEDVVIGKTSPPKFLSEAREISVRTRKESSSAIRQEERGVVDAVFVTIDNEGNRLIQVRTRDQRIPELGDKFSTPYGQKGVIGRIVSEADIPFTTRGIRPDVIFNPHGIPSRMTMGYLLEVMGGKVGSSAGRIIDGTAFSGESKEELEDHLRNLGFRFDGKESMYDAITGRKMTAKIFVGEMYYLKLKHMVSNKLHARASGKVQLLTRQPIEGRSMGGALRLGEMEQQALVAHGASLLLKERYDSDKVVLPICSKCGGVSVEDRIKNKVYCPSCTSSEIEYVEVSYAFKLLVDELQGLHIKTKFDLKNKYE
ncbi:DNA-directed RNA polymerase subunit B [Candidatus Pacearchaeota archaeon CG10_big_fil_rev_8_21_14_0_10_35_13]|nr:MAG: DNA-directed RNA polymerase subunit B [Candidatus Pacearchaeota archaeon CG10_big_fil_rev_8_21_14_0_10_35_13]